ncbi:tautomerase PptA [Salmonella enterica subsp. enterica serovar Choleraesuis]|nr:tautomerase PptA [Salmonella enterica subsp. enterica serovar Choleraesuis]
MPHIDVKFFKRELSEQERTAFADELCAVVKKHLGSKDSALSVALTGVEPSAWKEDVYDVEILPAMDSLAKKPGYSM